MEIGAKLKEAREDQNISLESLQETTKIQKRYLEAIEQGNFEILPGKFYARAFIKEYASAVGLDSNELIEAYKEEVPQTEEESTTQYTHIQRSRKDNNPAKSSAIFSFIPTVIVVLLVVGIIFLALFFYRATLSDESAVTEEPQNDNTVVRESDNEGSGDNQQANDDGNADSKQEGTDAGSDTGTEENSDGNDQSGESEASQPELVVEEEGTGTPPESTLTLENASEELNVVLETSGSSWVQVENDNGDVLFSNTITSDDSPVELDVSEANRLWFNVGSASSLDIAIDGVALEYPVNAEEETFQHLWININKASEQTDET